MERAVGAGSPQPRPPGGLGKSVPGAMGRLQEPPGLRADMEEGPAGEGLQAAGEGLQAPRACAAS